MPARRPDKGELTRAWQKITVGNVKDATRQAWPASVGPAPAVHSWPHPRQRLELDQECGVDPNEGQDGRSSIPVAVRDYGLREFWRRQTADRALIHHRLAALQFFPHLVSSQCVPILFFRPSTVKTGL
jgi:hypothetical protein